MSTETTRTVDDVLRDYEVIFSGRTRYAGQELHDDELLVAEIERLRSGNAVLKRERARLLGVLRDLKAEVIQRCEGALMS